MPTRLILVGGFLGAGKTTLLLQAARLLTERGHRVGLVTNDQGNDLVDTALAAQNAVPVVEVAGGCFCCRFPDLTEALRLLQRTANPDVILAEPVGSCTDLMATVLRPLLAYYPNDYAIAPLIVLLDPTRQLSAYTGEVSYLYDKQLAEAEIIVVSKAELLEPAQRAELVHGLVQRHAPVQVMSLSARTGEGVETWLEDVLNQTSQFARPLELDYQRYAEAEARLGWLNVSGVLHSQQPFAVKNWITHFLRLLDSSLTSQNAALAHVKIQAMTPASRFKASLTQSGDSITWDWLPEAENTAGVEFILNARVHTTPTILEQAVRWSFAEATPAPTFHYDFTHFECFSPAPPRPTHRLV